MLSFNLQAPINLVLFGEFISPERNWKHITRRLYEYELIIVTEGEMWIADDQNEYCVKAGEYLIMPPTSRQQGTRVSKCRFWWLHFNCPNDPPSISLPKHSSYMRSDMINQLCNELLRSETEAPKSLRSSYLATLLLLDIYRGQELNLLDNSKGAKLCENIKVLIAKCRYSEVRIKDIAHSLGYHEKYLATVFHETEGITLKHYLTRRRINEAKRLLLETDYSIAEISYNLNFTSPHNFSRFFKQEEGITASEFRLKERK